MKRTLITITLLCGVSCLGAQSYPLSENTWSNPEFVDRFLGTYGFDTEKHPPSQKRRARFSNKSRVSPVITQTRRSRCCAMR